MDPSVPGSILHRLADRLGFRHQAVETSYVDREVAPAEGLLAAVGDASEGPERDPHTEEQDPEDHQ